jgi:hypothetical protein
MVPLLVKGLKPKLNLKLVPNEQFLHMVGGACSEDVFSSLEFFNRS